MKTWLLNFLMTKAGARLAPVILTALASFVATVAAQVPWLAPHATMPNCLLVIFFILGVGMSFLNYLTTARGFKYAGPIQRFLTVLAENLGLPPLKQDSVLAGKSAETAIQLETILTAPGAPFNPLAEVRRAQPVMSTKRLPRVGLNKGHALAVILFVLAGICLAASLLACQSPKVGEAFPDVTETPILQYSVIHTDEYHRPAWQRLLSSIRPYTEVGTAKGKVTAGAGKVEVTGSYKDGQNPTLADWKPETYAVGIGGGLEF